MTKLRIEAQRGYDVLIGAGISDGLCELIKPLGGQRIVLVCGDTVAGLYGEKVRKNLENAGFSVHTFVYPHGESSKNMQTLTQLLSFMAQSGLDRHDLAVALGGGVTGDLTGFAAACYMRGIAYVQVPTTLLAMVDSSVGGKTAVDLPEGKNLAGAFWQPSLVICDTDMLKTLPREIFTDGCAEVVKYAVLRRPELLNDSDVEALIAGCIEIKADFVRSDEHDLGLRRLLNLGHTVGHAVETRSGFAMSHGRAVAIGLSVICRAAEAHGDCEKGTAKAVTDALSALGLPTACPYPASELCKLISADKKAHGDDITIAIPRRLGECELKSLPMDELYAYLLPGFGDAP